jgi:3-hydroxyacyl-[acyl-carrier-protein] dehydratase
MKTADDALSLLVHRQPYRFIDEIVRYEAKTGITCKTTIRGDEPYFIGHFPGHPILPGVFEIEMLYQAAELFLMMEETPVLQKAIGLETVDNARFTSPIVPPRELTISVQMREPGDGGLLRFSGKVSDGAETFVTASFSVKES